MNTVAEKFMLTETQKQMFRAIQADNKAGRFIFSNGNYVTSNENGDVVIRLITEEETIVLSREDSENYKRLNGGEKPFNPEINEEIDRHVASFE